MIQSYGSILKRFTEALETSPGFSIPTWHHLWCVTTSWTCSLTTNKFQRHYDGQDTKEMMAIIAAVGDGIIYDNLKTIEHS